MGLLLFTILFTPSGGDAVNEYRVLAEEYIRGFYAFHPSWATFAGIHDHDGDLDDWSPEAIDGEIRRVRSALERMQKVDPSALPVVDRQDLLRLKRHARAELLRWEELRAHERNPIEYNEVLSWALDDLVMKDFAPKEVRLEKIIERESHFARFFAQARKNLQRPARIHTEKAIELVGGTVEFLRDTIPDAFTGVGGADLQERFAQQNAVAIRETEKFLEFLKKDLLPRSKGEFALGKDLYRKKLSLEEMVDLSLEELRARGEEALRRTRKAFIETARRIDADADPMDVFEAMKDDHPSAEDLIESARKTLAAQRRFIREREIVTLPEGGVCEVLPMPPYMWGFAAINTPGPLEEVARKALYYIDPVDEEWDEETQRDHLREFSRPSMEITTIHEVYPGHYVQALHLQKARTFVRRALWSDTYCEGWAHYCEQMMIDEGYGGDDPEIRLAQLADALLRLCRYRVALGLHAEGMTLEEAQGFFEAQGFLSPYAARREAVRGTFNPLYLSYALGKMQILELREDYREKMGEAYTLRDFHDRFLAAGEAPIAIVRETLLQN
jgi:uncharacterized protein (DUF885 family)